MFADVFPLEHGIFGFICCAHGLERLSHQPVCTSPRDELRMESSWRSCLPRYFSSNAIYTPEVGRRPCRRRGRGPEGRGQSQDPSSLQGTGFLPKLRLQRPGAARTSEGKGHLEFVEPKVGLVLPLRESRLCPCLLFVSLFPPRMEWMHNEMRENQAARAPFPRARSVPLTAPTPPRAYDFCVYWE